jgi:hypothetical protein
MPVPDFSPGEVLTAAAMDSIGLWLVKSQTIGAGVASVNVTDAFSADYDNYRITVTGITPVASNTFRLMIGSGRTNGHYGVMNYNLSTGVGIDSIKANDVASIYCVLTNGGVLDAQFTCDITTPFLSQRTFMFGQGFGRAYYCDFGGADTSTSSYTSFTILTDGNNMSGGTIKVYGYRK